MKELAENRLMVVEQTTASCPKKLLHDSRDLWQGVATVQVHHSGSPSRSQNTGCALDADSFIASLFASV